VNEQQSFPGIEGQINVYDEAQLRSIEARRIFEAEEGYMPWMDDYWRLIAEGWTWKKAVYMLWAALPKDKRKPKTQNELAVQVLGLTTDRRIHDWKQNPAMDAAIAILAKSALLKHRPEIYAALIESASNPDSRSHADRKLALEMLGDYMPRQSIRLGAEIVDGGEAELSIEELRAIEAGPETTNGG